MSSVMAKRKPASPSPAPQPEEASPKRSRYAFDPVPGIPEAANRRAAKLTIQRKRNVTISEVINEILSEGLAEELEELGFASDDN